MSDSPQGRFDRASRILEEAWALRAEERKEFLDHVLRDDAKLRKLVEDLLVAKEKQARFLESGEIADPVPALRPERGSGDQDQAELAEREGTRIGNYKLLQEIGQGGFGIVFMADQEKPVRRRVALKLIKLGMDTRQVVARFEQERQALALMDHPNIAKVLDAGSTESGRPFFVMELVKGVPITEYCDTNNLTPRERLELFIPVCRAVQHAHQKGIIHRDIKPSNVLVTLHDGVPVPKIIDFGIAKATDRQLTDKTLFTEMRRMMGTPVYMSPEQAEMSGLDIDTRTDIYSLGVLLYELLTGTTPFTKEELFSAGYEGMQRMIREIEPPRPSTRVSTMKNTLSAVANRRRTEPRKLGLLLRGELDWVVMKALEKDRRRRYDTATALAEDVQRHLDGDRVHAVPPSQMYRLQKVVRRNKGLVFAGTAVGLSLLIGGALSAWGWRSERALNTRLDETNGQLQSANQQLMERTRVAQEAQARAEDAKERSDRDAYLRNLNTASSALGADDLPKARRYLDKCVPELRGPEWTYLKCKAHRARAVLRGSEAVFSPVGDRFAVSDREEGKIMIHDAQSLNPIHEGIVVLHDAANVQQMEWMNSGRRILIRSAGVLQVWDVDTRQLKFDSGQTWERTHYRDEQAVIAFDHSGETIAVSYVDGVLRILDNSETVEFVHEAQLQHGELLAAAFSRDDRQLAITCRDGVILVWDMQKKAVTATSKAMPEAQNHVAFFDGDRQIVASTPGVTIWNPTKGTQSSYADGLDAVPDPQVDGALWVASSGLLQHLIPDEYTSDLALFSGSTDLTIDGPRKLLLGAARVRTASNDTAGLGFVMSGFHEFRTLGGHSDRVHNFRLGALWDRSSLGHLMSLGAATSFAFSPVGDLALVERHEKVEVCALENARVPPYLVSEGSAAPVSMVTSTGGGLIEHDGDQDWVLDPGTGSRVVRVPASIVEGPGYLVQLDHHTKTGVYLQPAPSPRTSDRDVAKRSWIEARVEKNSVPVQPRPVLRPEILRRIDLRTGEELPWPDASEPSVEFGTLVWADRSPAGWGAEAASVKRADPRTGSVREYVPGSEPTWALASAAQHGRWVSGSAWGADIVWDRDTAREVARSYPSKFGDGFLVTFGGVGDRFVVRNEAGHLALESGEAGASRVLDPAIESCRNAQFVAGGRTLLTISEEGLLELWDAETGRNIVGRQSCSRLQTARDRAIGDGGKLAAVSDADSVARIYDLRTGVELGTNELAGYVEGERVLGVIDTGTYESQRGWLLTTTPTGEVRLWILQAGGAGGGLEPQLLRTAECKSGNRIRADEYAYVEASRSLLVRWGTRVIWYRFDGLQTSDPVELPIEIEHLGVTVVERLRGKILELQNSAEDRVLFQAETRDRLPYGQENLDEAELELLNDGEQCLVTWPNGDQALVETLSGQVLKSWKSRFDPRLVVDADPKTAWVAEGGDAGRFTLTRWWTVEGRTVETKRGQVTALELSTERDVCGVGTDSGWVELYGLHDETNAIRAEVRAGESRITALSSTPDGSHWMVVQADGSWVYGDSNLVAIRRGRTEPHRSCRLAWAGASTKFVALCDDRMVVLDGARTDPDATSLETSVRAWAMSHDGLRVATVDAAGVVRIWRTQDETMEFEKHLGDVTAMCFDPARGLVIGHRDGNLEIVSTSGAVISTQLKLKGEPVRLLAGPRADRVVALLKNGNQVLIVPRDDGWEELTALDGQAKGLTEAEELEAWISPDAVKLFAAHRHGSARQVRGWNLDPPEYPADLGVEVYRKKK